MINKDPSIFKKKEKKEKKRRRKKKRFSAAKGRYKAVLKPPPNITTTHQLLPTSCILRSEQATDRGIYIRRDVHERRPVLRVARYTRIARLDLSRARRNDMQCTVVPRYTS